MQAQTMYTLLKYCSPWGSLSFYTRQMFWYCCKIKQKYLHNVIFSLYINLQHCESVFYLCLPSNSGYKYYHVHAMKILVHLQEANISVILRRVLISAHQTRCTIIIIIKWMFLFNLCCLQVHIAAYIERVIFPISSIHSNGDQQSWCLGHRYHAHCRRLIF